MTEFDPGMTRRRSHVADALDGIEGEMRRLQIWSPVAPDASALSSELPFCYDTLSLAQWLQWVFLPRMRRILDAAEPLPAQSSIWPLAQEEFGGLAGDASRLLHLIRRFDLLVSASAADPGLPVT
jgi:uncharacterized protein YqcC (DUF446 family)